MLVRARVVGEEEPQENEDEVLECEAKPIDVAPGGVFCDDAGK